MGLLPAFITLKKGGLARLDTASDILTMSVSEQQIDKFGIVPDGSWFAMKSQPRVCGMRDGLAF
jgi:hypothetical protein